MTNADFNRLIDLVVNTGLTPPAALFREGFEDWYTRAALAKFLSHPMYGRIDEAIALFESITHVTTESPLELEQKACSFKQLSLLLRKYKQDFPHSLNYICEAIKIAESTDYQFQTVVRGELWGVRWNLLAKLHQSKQALQEANQKIQQFNDISVLNNSYIYNAYRFKAQLSGAQGNVTEFLQLMKKALAVIRLDDKEKKALAVSFSAKHRNIPMLLQSIDLATPQKIAWSI